MLAKVITGTQLTALRDGALTCERKRLHLNVHGDFDSEVQMFWNVALSDSYIRPHKHHIESGDETILVVSGECALILFDDVGNITKIINLRSMSSFLDKGAICVTVPALVFHTVVMLSEYVVLFETKKGPFNPQTAKVFAAWAPAEDANESKNYLSSLKEQCC